jgi:hypothetical protein
MVFFSFVTRIAYRPTKSSCVSRQCVTKEEVIEIKFGNYWHSKFKPTYWHKLHRAANILAQGYPSLILLWFLSLSLYLHISAISFSLSLHLPAYLHLPPQKIVLYFAETEYIEIKDDSKIERHKNHWSKRSKAHAKHMPPSRPSFVLFTDYL